MKGGDMAETVGAQEASRMLSHASFDELPALLERFADDPRKQVQKALATARRRREREQAERAAMKAQGTPVSDDKTISRDITLAIPWNVFTTGTLSVVEPGTVLRARVLADTVISEDVRPKEEIKKPVPKPKKPKKPVARRPKKRKARKRPGRKCPCCFICHCEERTGRPCGAWKNQPCPPPAAPAPAAPTPAPAPAPAPEAPAPAPETAQKS